MRRALQSLFILPILVWSQVNFAYSRSFIHENFKSTELEFLNSPQMMRDQSSKLLTYELVKIISEPQDGLIHKLTIQTDDNGKIINLVRETENSTDKQVVRMEDLIRNPVVLARASDRDILILSCSECSTRGGGELVLEYLYNGITMKYRDLEMNLDPSRTNDGGTSWRLFTENKKTRIETLRLIPRKIFGKLVGIKRILINE